MSPIPFMLACMVSALAWALIVMICVAAIT